MMAPPQYVQFNNTSDDKNNSSVCSDITFDVHPALCMSSRSIDKVGLVEVDEYKVDLMDLLIMAAEEKAATTTPSSSSSSMSSTNDNSDSGDTSSNKNKKAEERRFANSEFTMESMANRSEESFLDPSVYEFSVGED